MRQAPQQEKENWSYAIGMNIVCMSAAVDLDVI